LFETLGYITKGLCVVRAIEASSADEGICGSAAGGAVVFTTADVPVARRLLQRYTGHCNIQTDIKEACFLGDNDELVAAGKQHVPATLPCFQRASQ
jgi:hypothetical protein